MRRAKLRGPHPFGPVGCQVPAPLMLTVSKLDPPAAAAPRLQLHQGVNAGPPVSLPAAAAPRLQLHRRVRAGPPVSLPAAAAPLLQRH